MEGIGNPTYEGDDFDYDDFDDFDNNYGDTRPLLMKNMNVENDDEKTQIVDPGIAETSFTGPETSTQRTPTDIKENDGDFHYTIWKMRRRCLKMILLSPHLLLPETKMSVI